MVDERIDPSVPAERDGLRRVPGRRRLHLRRCARCGHPGADRHLARFNTSSRGETHRDPELRARRRVVLGLRDRMTRTNLSDRTVIPSVSRCPAPPGESKRLGKPPPTTDEARTSQLASPRAWVSTHDPGYAALRRAADGDRHATMFAIGVRSVLQGDDLAPACFHPIRRADVLGRSPCRLGHGISGAPLALAWPAPTATRSGRVRSSVERSASGYEPILATSSAPRLFRRESTLVIDGAMQAYRPTGLTAAQRRAARR